MTDRFVRGAAVGCLLLAGVAALSPPIVSAGVVVLALIGAGVYARGARWPR
jgi:hypothetical protein